MMVWHTRYCAGSHLQRHYENSFQLSLYRSHSVTFQDLGYITYLVVIHNPKAYADYVQICLRNEDRLWSHVCGSVWEVRTRLLTLCQIITKFGMIIVPLEDTYNSVNTVFEYDVN